jgi:hypothetical protein
MNGNEARETVLLSHPYAPGEAVWRIAVAVRRLGAASLVCQYSLQGDLTRIRVPGARAGRRADGLWQHTCFEAFVRAEGDLGYCEFNFSPGLDWAAYRFAGYRQEMMPANVTQAPGLNVRRAANRLELSATVYFHGIGALVGAPRLRVGLAAVIEEDGGTLSYWALRHARGDPDFHHPDSFALELEAP